jgi:tetratricopeptide (TPR) repeat protein
MSHSNIAHKYPFNTSRLTHFRPVLAIFSFLFLCVGCVSTQQLQTELLPVEHILNDDVFPNFHLYEIEKPAQIFALNDDAKTFVRNSILGARTGDDKVQSLIQHIFDRSDLDLIYETSANTNATDTFNRASANCLSLSIMTYAMAKEAGFSSQFQIIDIPELWTRRDGYTLLNSHVNVKIGAKAEIGKLRLYDIDFEVDFDPQTRSKKFSSKGTNIETVVAMFYNNKGADALLQGNNNLAYAYFREAILSSQEYSGTWVNLGFLYRKQGQYDLALKSYKQAIAIDEDYNTAWENLAFLYDRTGNLKAAADIRTRLESKRMNNPFYHQMLAEIDEDEGSFDSSVSHYKKAIRLDSNQHQFYFGLATIYFKKGEFDQSKHYLKLAQRKAGTRKVASAYVNKLNALSTYIERSEH